MSALFLKILNLSINASWLILAVIAARLLLKKAPRWISCLLWGLVAVRLLCPISLESVLSILPSAKVVPDNIEMVQDPHIDSGVRIIDNAVNPVIEKSFSPDAASSVNPMQVVVFMGSIIWLTGMTVMLLYALISYILLRRKVRASVAVNGRVKECDEVDSPFILGIFRPEIYVPSGINEDTLELVIAHEEAHLKRHDHWWKPFGFVLLAVYWFNPLCWVAYILLCRDIEAACDEKVIKDKDREYMAAYSQALLDCSVNRRIIAACPLAFGETGVKERVKGVLNYKKPAFWVIIVAVIACIVVAVCFMTNPKKDEPDLSFLNYKNSINLLIMDGSLKQVLYYSEEYSGNESVQELTANAEDIARFLSDADWKQTDNVSERPSSNGSIELIISDEYTITLYKDQSIACVYSSGHERFYDIQPGDYENLLKMLLSHTEDNVSDNSGRDEIVRPEVNLSAREGADLTELLYADQDRIIFSGYYGLFAYSKERRMITNAIDLESIGCNYTQGDNYCEKYVSADGKIVYLHPMSGAEMYVYDISSDTLSQEKYNLEGRKLHALQHNEEGEIFDVWNNEERMMETHLHHGSYIGELGYVEYGRSSADKVIQYYPLFSPEGLSGAVDFAPEDIHDIVSVDMWITRDQPVPGLEVLAETVRLHCDDRKICERIGEMLAGAEKETGQSGCPFYTALYLTRSDGTIGTVFPATDSCSMYLSGKECYRFAEGTNEAFWSLISEFGILNGEENRDNLIGLNMTASDISPTGCKLVFTQDGGNTTGQLETGEWFEIQVKNSNGEWIDNSSKDIERGWEDIAYLISNNGTTELDLDWEHVYGYLADGHYRIVKKVMDYRSPGDYDEYDVYAEFDIGNGIASAESVTDWMDITLPSGYSISSFDDTIGYMGGSLILPRSYHAEDSEYGPLEWQYSGLISRLPADSGMATVTFDNGIPDPSSMPRDNHTDAEYLKTIGLERSNTQWSAVMLKENHDLYTASQLSEMKDEGIDLTGKELTSDYWTFWFVKEGEDTYYLLTLSAKEFTQEEAEEIARTVSIK